MCRYTNVSTSFRLAHKCVIFLKLTHMYTVNVLEKTKMMPTICSEIIQANQHFYNVPFEPYNIFVSGPQAFGFDVRDY